MGPLSRKWQGFFYVYLCYNRGTEVITISQLTETLSKNLDSMIERIQSNTENVTREIYMFVPLVSLREPYGVEVVGLAKKIRDADIGVRIVMERNRDLDINPIEGLDVILYVNKDTNLHRLMEIIKESSN